MKNKTIVTIVVCSVVCLLLGIASGFSTRYEIQNWYQYLDKPSWTPPNWLFGPVWTLLYIMMGTALGLVIESTVSERRIAIRLFIVQFLLNLCWSFIFFNQHETGFAFAEILLLLTFILLTTVKFYRVRPLAGYLMIPYIIWVSYASALNGAIWLLNR